MTPESPALRFLLERRSVSALVGPAPTREQLALMVRAAGTVPDHGELRPSRFVIVDTDAGRERFGNALAAAAHEARPDLSPGLLEKLKKKAYAAPALVIVLASPLEGHKIPVWEQVAAASCCGYALALAADALGLGAIWKSAGVLEGAELRSALSLGSSETILGWINVGHPAKAEPQAPRPPLDLKTKAAVLDGSAGLVPLEG